jgi:hypothetical protein
VESVLMVTPRRLTAVYRTAASRPAAPQALRRSPAAGYNPANADPCGGRRVEAT